MLDRGTAVENFVFNYLDYRLWKFDWEDHKNDPKKKQNYKDFKFTFRSSVEHHYPQNPPGDLRKLDEVDKFGNLCLISSSENSCLSNFPPMDKKEHIENNIKKGKIESIKQVRMIEKQETKGKWGENEILEHGKEMKEILGLCCRCPMNDSTCKRK